MRQTGCMCDGHLLFVQTSLLPVFLACRLAGTPKIRVRICIRQSTSAFHKGLEGRTAAGWRWGPTMSLCCRPVITQMMSIHHSTQVAIVCLLQANRLWKSGCCFDHGQARGLPGIWTVV